jgi:hypothetical protein
VRSWLIDAAGQLLEVGGDNVQAPNSIRGFDRLQVASRGKRYRAVTRPANIQATPAA